MNVNGAQNVSSKMIIIIISKPNELLFFRYQKSASCQKHGSRMNTVIFARGRVTQRTFREHKKARSLLSSLFAAVYVIILKKSVVA